MNRRNFVKKTAVSSLLGSLVPVSLRADNLDLYSEESGELLYNGIKLPEIWPPTNIERSSYSPMPVPYLKNQPKVIPIDIGRQLFVDDFLIEHSSLTRKFHKAKKIENNPVLKPVTDLEKGNDGLPVACPKDGGVWWDPKDQVYKMWYEAGWIGSMAYAESKDGIHWERPKLDPESGTNRILKNLLPDSTTVFLDHQAKNRKERFKMFLRGPNFAGQDHGFCMVSEDGIDWGDPVKTGFCGDRSTMFYNPFRKKWIYSIRSTKELGPSPIGRSRYYHEHDDFLEGADWNDNIVYWTGADYLDKPDPDIGEKAQLYNLSAVGYESLMLGLHQIHLGPPNNICQKNGIPKITELMISFSRDGFHWDRQEREAFIPATRKPGDWDRGYVQSVGGICTIVGEELWFYYIGFKGDQTNLNPDGMKNGMYANGSTGIAVLRRDGFASMEAEGVAGELTTRLTSFKGKHLFVNTDCPQGKLTVEILNEQDEVIHPYSSENCTPISVDKTIKKVGWKNVEDLSPLIGKPVKFRFNLTNGKIYSFWVSQEKSGSSQGYVAAGGPGFKSDLDDVGLAAYEKASGYTQFLHSR